MVNEAHCELRDKKSPQISCTFILTILNKASSASSQFFSLLLLFLLSFISYISFTEDERISTKFWSWNSNAKNENSDTNKSLHIFMIILDQSFLDEEPVLLYYFTIQIRKLIVIAIFTMFQLFYILTFFRCLLSYPNQTLFLSLHRLY